MSHLNDFLGRTHLGPRQFHKLLSLWPILPVPGAPGAGGPEYVALADALEDGFVSIAEVDEQGRVPHVAIDNRAATAVLILFGEELRGAQQNRVANASFLLPARQRVVIDVSCVEAGRWETRRGRLGAALFQRSAGVLSSAIRRKMQRKVRLSRARTGTFDADQGEVWDSVSMRLSSSGVGSDSSAYADYARSRESDIGEIAKAFHVMEGQMGFVAAIGDEVVGLEAVGRPEVFARVFPTLLQAYAIDAVDAELIENRRRRQQRHFEAPGELIAALLRAPEHTGASLGAGTDVRFESQTVEGCALVAEGRLVHVTAFPV